MNEISQNETTTQPPTKVILWVLLSHQDYNSNIYTCIFTQKTSKYIKQQSKTFQIKKKFQLTLEFKPTLSLFEIWVDVAQKSLFTFSKAHAFITSLYLSSSYFFPNKMLLLTVPGNTQGCWETYAILPWMLTFPWIKGISRSKALNSDDWNRQQHTNEQAALRMEHARSTADPTLVLDTG